MYCAICYRETLRRRGRCAPLSMCKLKLYKLDEIATSSEYKFPNAMKSNQKILTAPSMEKNLFDCGVGKFCQVLWFVYN